MIFSRTVIGHRDKKRSFIRESALKAHALFYKKQYHITSTVLNHKNILWYGTYVSHPGICLWYIQLILVEHFFLY